MIKAAINRFYNADGDTPRPSDFEQTQAATENFYNDLDRATNLDLIKGAADKAKNSASGAIVGATIGLGIGLVLRKGIWITTIIGSIAGGFIGSMWNMNLTKYKENSSSNS